MPRRGSRAQLIHLLAKEDVLNYAWMHGPLLPPAAFYDVYRGYSLAHLEEVVAEMRLSPKRGRPKRYWTDAEVDKEVNRRLKSGHSERRACEIVAHLRRVDHRALRMRYRRYRRAVKHHKLTVRLGGFYFRSLS